MLKVFIFLLFFAIQVFSSGMEPLNILNFSAVNGANDMVRINDTIFVATNGGLARFQNSSGNFISLHHSHEQFPEISLSALEADDGGLWIGSENGYLYYRQNNRRQKIYDDLFVVKSKINQIKSHKNYLIISHSNGISVFDKKNGRIVSTKRNFDGLPNSTANLILIKDNSLFISIKSENGKSAVIALNNFEEFLGNAQMNDNSPLASRVPWKTELIQDEDIKTVYFDKEGKVTTNEKFVVFHENYRVEGGIKDEYIGIRKYDNYSNEEIEYYIFGSEINFLKFIDGKIAVGTKYDFAYFFDYNNYNENHKQFVLPGLVSNTEVSKLFVDSDNSLWILPEILQDRMSGINGGYWWNALAKMAKNNSTDSYKYQYGFGWTQNGCTQFTGVAQSGSKMFFGICGDPLRQFNMNTDEWGRWFFDIRMDRNIPFSYSDSAWFVISNGTAEEQTGEYYWMKLDNMVNIGNKIYGTYWRDLGIVTDKDMPLLFELNPSDGSFQFLLPKPNVTDLAVPNGLVANDNGMLLSFADNKELWFINHKNYDSVANTISISDNPLKLQLTGAKNVLVATSGKPVIINNSIKEIQISNLPERFSSQTNDVVLEYSDSLWSENDNQTVVRNVFWIANAVVGVERVVIDEYISLGSGNLEAAVYDSTQTVFAFSPLNGGINSEVSALAIDSVQNFLWIGGDKGITRIRLPERASATVSKKNDFIFPNPFVLSRHQTLSIPATQNSFVDIYTISGKLVKHIDENSAEHTRTIDGTFIYKWKIPQNFAAGNYIIAVKSFEGDKISRKNTKQYKLLVIK